jgi:hypothetical protein
MVDRAGEPDYKPALPSRLAAGSAQVAQLVEHATENRSVGGSIPPLGTIQNSSANHSGRCCRLKHILAVFDADPKAVDLDRVDEISLTCFPDWN